MNVAIVRMVGKDGKVQAIWIVIVPSVSISQSEEGMIEGTKERVRLRDDFHPESYDGELEVEFAELDHNFTEVIY